MVPLPLESAACAAEIQFLAVRELQILPTRRVTRSTPVVPFGGFADILGDGSVVTWGSAAHGGDNRSVQDQLRNVQHIQACIGAVCFHPCQWLRGDLGVCYAGW